MSTHRVAVVQAGSVLFDTPRTLDKLAALIADAADRGAKLVVFPEAFIGGYPKGLGFGARMLGPLFARPLAWRILDGIIAVVMIAIAISLVLPVFFA